MTVADLASTGAVFARAPTPAVLRAAVAILGAEAGESRGGSTCALWRYLKLSEGRQQECEQARQEEPRLVHGHRTATIAPSCAGGWIRERSCQDQP